MVVVVIVGAGIDHTPHLPVSPDWHTQSNIQNIGLALIPVWIGKVNQANTGADGVIDYTETMTIFAAFGVIAIVISFLLLLEDKRKGYGLQQPNVKK